MPIRGRAPILAVLLVTTPLAGPAGAQSTPVGSGSDEQIARDCGARLSQKPGELKDLKECRAAAIRLRTTVGGYEAGQSLLLALCEKKADARSCWYAARRFAAEGADAPADQ